MVTVVFSDTHLTKKFEKAKFDFLSKLITPADRVIINGDFWDGYIVSFDDFIESGWKKLFPLLKSRETIYIFGNHDRESLSDKSLNLFSVSQRYIYKMKEGGKILHIEHDCRIAPAADDRYFWLPHGRIVTAVYQLLRERIPLAILGKPLLNYYKSQNNRMKKWLNSNLSENTILVCGHSHLAELDLRERYINTGFIRWGYGQYLKIDNGKMELIDKRY